MISISGIKYQEEMEKLPYFSKQAAGMMFSKEGKNLDFKVSLLLKKGYLVSLKKGLFTTDPFIRFNADKEGYGEYLANILRAPSYLSLEYVLAKYGLIPEGVYLFTSITIKSPRNYTNKIGSYVYRNIKEELFSGYENQKRGIFNIKIATKAKALFDYLYLKRNLNYKNKEEIKNGLRINWERFLPVDRQEFNDYVIISGSKKMKIITELIKE